jgi:hypothetical protein
MKRVNHPLAFSASGTPWERSHAVRGQSYHVVTDFQDADGDWHRVGEDWSFLGSGFDKVEDRMWLGLRKADASEWLLPLDWSKVPQGDVLDKWAHYVRPRGV